MPVSAPARLQRGFSLVEMAVVLAIVGLLIGGAVATVGAVQQRQRFGETSAQLEEIRDALIAFAVVNRRLPCPADPTLADTVAGAGLERAPTAAGCSGGISGAVPWATLALPQSDAWGRRFTYRVSAGFARQAPAFTLAATGDNVVRNASAVVLASAVPAVIVSHGANARGSRGPGGAVAAASPDARELENSDGDAEFVVDAPADGYDDLVTWVPGTVLAYRMLQAGALP
jgi:prepilin-type N-terminal cleavage/methylation domain-containing protein